MHMHRDRGILGPVELKVSYRGKHWYSNERKLHYTTATASKR